MNRTRKLSEINESIFWRFMGAVRAFIRGSLSTVCLSRRLVPPDGFHP